MHKLLSRKFLVTLGSLAAVLLDSGLSSLQLAVVATVAVTYVLAETFLDRRSVEMVAQAVEGGLELGRDAGARLDALESHAMKHTHHTGLGPTSPAGTPDEAPSR